MLRTAAAESADVKASKAVRQKNEYSHRCGRASRMAPIHDAVRFFDVEALRRELARGVSPNLTMDDDEGDDVCTLLYFTVLFKSGLQEFAKERLADRVACVAALLEAGAAVNATSYYNETALHIAVTYEAYGDIIDLLIAAGADVNALDRGALSALVLVAEIGCAAVVKKLISAGARDLDDALVRAVSNGRLHCCAPLLRAGAALPAEETTDGILRNYDDAPNHRDGLLIIRARAYIAKISGTPGGFRGYEREHRRRLTVVFANKFPALPLDVISHIVLLWAHCGDYDWEGYADAEE